MHEITLQELFNVGLHYGHKKEHSTPKSRQYVYTIRDGVLIFDLEKTKTQLEEALKTLKEAAGRGDTILFVGTKKQASPLVTALAQSLKAPYVTNRWLGGMLTNFTTVRKSLDHLADLKAQTEKPEFAKLKKREQKRITDEIAKLHRSFDGVKDLSQLPNVLVIIDAKQESIAIEEATRLGITTIATVDTNGDPTKVDMAIPCNDDAPRGLKYVLLRIGEAIATGRGEAFEAPTDLSVNTDESITIKKVGDA